MTLPPISRTDPLLSLDGGMSTLPGDVVARFASALETAASRLEAARGAPADVRAAAGLDPQTLIAADDAWVNILAISQTLRDGEVSAAEARALEALLLESWDAFQARLQALEAVLPARRGEWA